MRSMYRLILFFTVGLFSLGIHLISANELPEVKATLVSTPQELKAALSSEAKKIEISTSMKLDELRLGYPVEIEGQRGVNLTFTNGIIIESDGVELEDLKLTFKGVATGILIQDSKDIELDGLLILSGENKSNILLVNSTATLEDCTFQKGKYVDVRLVSKNDEGMPSILTLKGKQKFSTKVAILREDTPKVTHQVIGFKGRMTKISNYTTAYYAK